MFSACGPDGGPARMRAELALDELASRSRKRSGPGSSRPAVSNSPRSDSLGDRAAAEPGDHRVAVRAGCPTAPCGRWRRRSRRAPTASAFSSTTTRSALRERRAHLLEREGPKRLDAERADADALVAQLVDHVLDRAQHRAQRDHDRLGVVGPVAAQQAAGVAAEGLCELARDLGIRSSACICLAWARYLTSKKASGPTIAPIVTGSAGSSTWRGSKVGRKESTCSWAGMSTSRRRG